MVQSRMCRVAFAPCDDPFVAREKTLAVSSKAQLSALMEKYTICFKKQPELFADKKGIET